MPVWWAWVRFRIQNEPERPGCPAQIALREGWWEVKVEGIVLTISPHECWCKGLYMYGTSIIYLYDDQSGHLPSQTTWPVMLLYILPSSTEFINIFFSCFSISCHLQLNLSIFLSWFSISCDLQMIVSIFFAKRLYILRSSTEFINTFVTLLCAWLSSTEYIDIFVILIYILRSSNEFINTLSLFSSYNDYQLNVYFCHSSPHLTIFNWIYQQLCQLVSMSFWKNVKNNASVSSSVTFHSDLSGCYN